MEKTDVLEGSCHASLYDLIGFFAAELFVAEEKGAFGGKVYAGQQVEDGGLAGAVGADQSDQFSFVYFKVKIMHGSQTAKGDAEMHGAKYGFSVCHIIHPPLQKIFCGNIL